MSPSPTEDSSSDQWKQTSKKYTEQWTQFHLTSLYADDLITLLHDDIQRATTILDIGCGTGVFARAYLRAFPNGIAGQTLISSDISPAMIEQAAQEISKNESMKSASEVATINQTNFVFQLEDGSQLSGIADHSIDIVVSVYGVFLIPDQVATLQSIRRVLTPTTGIFANAAWARHDNIDSSFGGNLQDVFVRFSGMVKQLMPSTTTSDNTTAPPSPPVFFEWFEPANIAAKLSREGFVTVHTHRMFHSMISRNIHAMFEMLLQHPMINATNLSETDLKTVKDAFFEWCHIRPSSSSSSSSSLEEDPESTTVAVPPLPVTFWTAANLTISHV